MNNNTQGWILYSEQSTFRMIGKIFFPLKLYMIFFIFLWPFSLNCIHLGMALCTMRFWIHSIFMRYPPLRKPKMLFNPPPPITPPPQETALQTSPSLFPPIPCFLVLRAFPFSFLLFLWFSFSFLLFFWFSFSFNWKVINPEWEIS